MNDEKAIAVAIHAGLQSDDVTDLYTGDCRGCGECCCDYGICEVEFDDAFREKFDGADAEPSDVAYWALPWIANHMRDMQEEACAMFCG